MGSEKVPDYPGPDPIEPFESDYDRFEKLALELLAQCKRIHPELSEEQLEQMAEEMAAEMFFGSDDKKRSN
jgi:hypothetical protein